MEVRTWGKSCEMWNWSKSGKCTSCWRFTLDWAVRWAAKASFATFFRLISIMDFAETLHAEKLQPKNSIKIFENFFFSFFVEQFFFWEFFRFFFWSFFEFFLESFFKICVSQFAKTSNRLYGGDSIAALEGLKLGTWC